MSQTASSSSSQRPQRPGNVELEDRVRSLQLSRIPDGASYIRTLAAWGFGLAVVVVCGWLGYQAIASRLATPAAAENKSPPDAAKADAASSAKNPRASAVKAAPKGEIALEAKGYIIPAHQILVSPKVSGMIEELMVEEGKRVEAGEPLAILESKEYQYEVERATATEQAAAARWREAKRRLADLTLEVNQTQAQIDEASEQVAQLKLEWDRKKGLRKSGAINEQEFEEIDSKLKVAQKHQSQLEFAHELMKTAARQERLDAALGEWDQAKAEVLKAKWKLDNCRIVAPIKGTILRKNAEKGNIVNPVAFNGSYSICEMADLSDLEVDLNIQERDIAVIKVGQRCQVRADAWPDRVYNGVVSRLMPIADRAKGAIPVRVKLSVPADEEGVYLKPEMGAVVTFLNSAAAPAATADKEPAAPPMAEETGSTSAFPASEAAPAENR